MKQATAGAEFDLIYLIVAVEILLLLEMRRRIPILNPAELSCLLVIVSQVIYVNGTALSYANAPWATYSFEKHPTPTLLLYAANFLLIYGCTLGIRQKNRLHTSGQIKKAAIVAMRYQIPTALVVYAMTITGIFLIKQSILWHNNLYLLLGSADSLRVDSSLGSLFLHICNYAGFISIFFLSAAIAFKRRIAALLWLPPALWVIAFALAESSRFSVVGIAAIFIMLWILSDYPRVLLLGVFGGIGGIALLATLSARNEGSFGLSAIPFIVSRAFVGRTTVSDLILNLFQGIFITGDGLDYHVTFPFRYKLLSFSPFPSFIDGFDAIREIDEVRLFSYVPMSALTESIFFGVGWYLLLIGTFCVAFRLAIKRAPEMGGFYLFVVVTGFASFLLSGAYPVRNIYRQILINIAITLIVSWWNRRKRLRAAPARAGGRHRRLQGTDHGRKAGTVA